MGCSLCCASAAKHLSSVSFCASLVTSPGLETILQQVNLVWVIVFAHNYLSSVVTILLEIHKY